MDYQVWTKEEFGETWKRVDCGDKEAAMREIDKAVRSGQEPLLTVAIPYKLNIKLEEDKIGEITPRKAKRDQGPGVESEGKVRPGAPEPVPELGEGDRDSSPGDSVPGQ